jgi:hypothetical protein
LLAACSTPGCFWSAWAIRRRGRDAAADTGAGRASLR